jgi:cytochrome c oxidase assembly factor CtaG/putative copper export protein
VRLWPWLVSAAPVALLAALLGVAVTGAAAPTLVGDPGAFVRWATPVLGTLLQLVQAVTLGGLVMLTFVLPGGNGQRDDGGAWRLVRTVTSVAGPVWALLAVLDIVLGYALVAGRPIGGEGFGDELGFYVTEISTGRAQLVTAVLAAVLATACAAVSGYRTALVALVLGVGVLVPVATQGHAAGTFNHELGMNGIFGHVLGAAVWTGGLVILALTGRRLGKAAPAVAGRFSAIAVWCFAIVAVSGIASAWIRVGSPAELDTRYGMVLVAKIVLLGLLGAAGWWHRRRTIANLQEGRGRAFWRLIGAEVALVGLASGLGIALSGSEPPLEQEPSGVLSPTELLSERPPPPTPTADAILTAFYPDLFFGFIAVAMLVVYLGWVLRLRRRGDTWPVVRTLSWVAGTLAFGYLVLGAPAVYGHVMLSVHMAAHMAYVMVVPILLVSAAPVTLALRALPARSDGSRGPREWLLGIVHSRWGQLVAQPVVAAVVFIGTMVLFYFTPLLYLASTTHLGHIGMIVHFVLSGYLFVNGLIGVDPGPRRPGYPMRLLLLLATMAAHAFFGVSITTMTELLAADYFGALGLPWGVDALADQRTAGAIAWGIGEVPSLLVAVLLAISWARDDARTARRKDRAADRDGDAELAAYNEMLSGLKDRADQPR